jgi:signal transduction histidine kinase
MPVLTAQNLSKQYGSLTVLRNVSFDLNVGEIVGLAGRNGAGKSTLIEILAGLVSADSGTVTRANKSRHDLAVIHPVPQLADQLDVTTNLFLGQEIGWSPLGEWGHYFPRQKKMNELATRLLTQLDAPFIRLSEPVGNLSAEERQLVAIARVLVQPRKLILIDDPNQQLSIPYRQKLLQLVRDWQRAGSCVLFSNDSLDDLFAVADRMLVLRGGDLALDTRTDATTRERVVTAFVGTDEREQRTPILWAMDSYYRAREQTETLRHNQRLLERDLQARDQLNQQLVEQLAEQVQALDSANLALQDAQRRLLTEREEERKRLAREIHDQAIQDLLSLNFELEEIEDRVTERTISADDITEIRQSIRSLVEDLRSICGDLRPPTIDSLGLEAALRSLARSWHERTGIGVSVEIGADFGRLPESLELSIFRIVQEGLNNIWKHANATHATVTLHANSPRLLLISVADNGRGIEPSFDLSTVSHSGHYGLLGISERVALMGGRLRFANQPDGGLLMQVEIPHPRMV